jgi:hypothetical protein
MEKNIEQNIMPRFELVSTGIIDRFRRMARFLMPQETELCLSNHIRRDSEPTNQPELPFGGAESARVAHYVELARQAKEQRAKNIPAYDSLGTYIEELEV